MEGRDGQERQQEAEQRRQLIQQLPNKKCPRCDSRDTRFSYFNNKDISQERYLCKNCKKYWTHHGKLRDVPEGVAVQKLMPVWESVQAGPYKITRVNSLDELFGSNSGSQAGGSNTNISQSATYNQEGAVVQKQMPVWESVEAGPHKITKVNSLDELFGFNSGSQAGGSNTNISQQATYNREGAVVEKQMPVWESVEAGPKITKVNSLDELFGFNSGSQAGGSNTNISQQATYNPEGAVVQKQMPVWESVEAGPHKIMKVNSLDELFGFNSGSQAGGSNTNISQPATYNPEGAVVQKQMPVWESVEAGPHKITRVNSLDEWFGFNSGSQAGGSNTNISQSATYNQAELNFISGNNTMWHQHNSDQA